MRHLYTILSCGLLVVGGWWIVQDFPRRQDSVIPFPTGLLAMAGLGVVLAGVLNLLNQAYGSTASGVRFSTIGANLALIALYFAVFMQRTFSSDWQLWIVPVLVALVSLLSFSRRSIRPTRAP